MNYSSTQPPSTMTENVILLPGQVYFDSDANSYLVITKKKGEMVSYRCQPSAGLISRYGQMEEVELVRQFPPVDPLDLTPEETKELLSYCDESVKELKIGFIA